MGWVDGIHFLRYEGLGIASGVECICFSVVTNTAMLMVYKTIPHICNLSVAAVQLLGICFLYLFNMWSGWRSRTNSEHIILKAQRKEQEIEPGFEFVLNFFCSDVVKLYSLPVARAGHMANHDNGMGPHSSMKKQILQVKQPHESVCSPFTEGGGSS